jgi:hypothetical protein
MHLSIGEAATLPITRIDSYASALIWFLSFAIILGSKLLSWSPADPYPWESSWPVTS